MMTPERIAEIRSFSRALEEAKDRLYPSPSQQLDQEIEECLGTFYSMVDEALDALERVHDVLMLLDVAANAGVDPVDSSPEIRYSRNDLERSCNAATMNAVDRIAATMNAVDRIRAVLKE